jgi:hypothetical protein
VKLPLETHGPTPRDEFRNASTLPAEAPAPPVSGIYAVPIPRAQRVPSFLLDTQRPGRAS